MSSLNKTQAHFGGLKVHNLGKSILNMGSDGKYSLKSETILNHSFNNLKSISTEDSIYQSLEGNLNILTNSGNIVLKSGNKEILYNIKSQLEENKLNEEIEEDIFFIDLENLNNIRENSLLIESLEKPICLYGNQGISHISHSNYKVISDREIIFQALRKLRFNTMGTLSLNSEKIIGSCQQDIVLISDQGDIKLGGDGLNNCGLVIDNENNLILGKPKLGIKNKSLNINIKNNNDGINILGEEEYPEINLAQKEKNVIFNLGCEQKDLNNSFFGKLSIENNNSYVEILNNLEFSLDDLGSNIIWENGGSNVINVIISKKKAIIENKSKISFDFRKGFIDRSNCANLKTKSNTNLYLGTNNLDILNFSKNGRVGLNTKNIEASFHITNNYGKVQNIRNKKDKTYFNYKFLQLENTNYIIFCNSLEKEQYSLEAFLYNIDNSLLNHSILKNESYEEIDYDVSLFSKNSNMFLVSLSFFNDSALFVHEINLYYDTLRRRKGFTKRFVNEDIEKSGCPLITSLENGGLFGHALIFRDRKDREEYNLNVYSHTNELIFNLELEPIEMNYQERNISKLMYLGNKIIYLDEYDNTNFYLVEIEIEVSKNKFVMKNLNKNEYLGKIDMDIRIINGNIYTAYINKDSKLYFNENEITDNCKFMKIIDLKGIPKLCFQNSELHLIDLHTRAISEIKNMEKYSNISINEIKDGNGEYIKSLLIWETDNDNSFFGESVVFTDFDSQSNLLKIENKENKIEIKDNGDVILEDLIEFSKKNGTTEIKNNLVLSEKDIRNEGGRQGQINYFNNELFVYLGNKWKKIKLEDL
jgi:hypothetical protein